MSVFRSDSQNKKGPSPSQPINTLLGKGVLWKGEVHAGNNPLRIEGTIEGSIHSDGEVTVAPSGVVIGTIQARHLVVTGRIEGVFKIEECLEIHGTGWVEGDVEVGSLVVDEGGTLQGTCTRKDEKAAQAPEYKRHEFVSAPGPRHPAPMPGPAKPAPAPTHTQPHTPAIPPSAPPQAQPLAAASPTTPTQVIPPQAPPPAPPPQPPPASARESFRAKVFDKPGKR